MPPDAARPDSAEPGVAVGWDSGPLPGTREPRASAQAWPRTATGRGRGKRFAQMTSLRGGGAGGVQRVVLEDTGATREQDVAQHAAADRDGAQQDGGQPPEPGGQRLLRACCGPAAQREYVEQQVGALPQASAERYEERDERGGHGNGELPEVGEGDGRAVLPQHIADHAAAEPGDDERRKTNGPCPHRGLRWRRRRARSSPRVTSAMVTAETRSATPSPPLGHFGPVCAERSRNRRLTDMTGTSEREAPGDEVLWPGRTAGGVAGGRRGSRAPCAPRTDCVRWPPPMGDRPR